MGIMNNICASCYVLNKDAILADLFALHNEPPLSLSLSLSLFPHPLSPLPLFVSFVHDNATMSSIPYFENHGRFFVLNQRK